ncbi:MAG: exosortase-associated EpsI family protein [Verrucomicrobia bacterium]|nr:MAG: exosortase-associated EpsI family protein [Verrucomicrobiota bacterium]
MVRTMSDVEVNDAAVGGSSPPRAAKATVGALTVAVALLWVFPRFWYGPGTPKEGAVWLTPRTEIPGWEFHEEPVDKVAERLLVADALFNGVYTNRQDRTVVRAFSAKRFTENLNDIGLFVHTPDRCWTQGGWKLEPSEPTHLELTVHGVKMVFERRIFVAGGHRELVYFGGMVGGEPTPFRLDHNYSVALKYQVKRPGQRVEQSGLTRALDPLFWRRLWDGFTTRSALAGPKQFIRVSTGILGDDVAAADRRLQAFLPEWLEAVDYQQELAAWEAKQS